MSPQLRAALDRITPRELGAFRAFVRESRRRLMARLERITLPGEPVVLTAEAIELHNLRCAQTGGRSYGVRRGVA